MSQTTIEVGKVYEFDEAGYRRWFSPLRPGKLELPKKVKVSQLTVTWGKQTCTVRTRGWGAADVPRQFVGAEVK